ncbi:MAG: AsnC family transcriptional regulator [Candidatus Lokiarchaeota archaeon]|nr:AsnC family transcriptional regulator [Candidatus Lokiarchaeota archaeon]
MGLKEMRRLDKLDNKIIQFLQKLPNMTHSDIAKEIERSQPAVGARVHKLEEEGILTLEYGFNFKNAEGIHIVKLDVVTSEPNKVLEITKYCPFVLNCLKMSGVNNLLIFMISTDLNKIDKIINHQFRNKPHIESVKMEIVTEFQKDWVFPINFKIYKLDPCSKSSCKDCAFSD